VACSTAPPLPTRQLPPLVPPADHGISTAFTATRVDFAIEEANATAGSQTVQVRLHTLSGAFVRSNLTTLTDQTVTIPNQSLTSMAVTLSPPRVIPAGSTLVFEVFSPNGTVTGNTFYLGSNTATETGPSYISPATGCVITEPATSTRSASPGPPGDDGQGRTDAPARTGGRRSRRDRGDVVERGGHRGAVGRTVARLAAATTAADRRAAARRCRRGRRPARPATA
jgi:hypothetical protein